mmetsp:Transcript_27723/g.38359  ORF Transcript_27723/g.38359 Transcript_27723/m.38359 type:complete len:162 (-) Transcript_27723:77-562(-)
MNNKRSILNRKPKTASKNNVGSIDREWQKEQARLQMLRRNHEKYRDMRARQLYGTRTEKAELKDMERMQMMKSKMEQRQRVKREKDLDRKAYQEAEIYQEKQDMLHKQREEARKSYLHHIASQNRKLETFRRRKKEVHALKDEINRQNGPDFFARFGRNAL